MTVTGVSNGNRSISHTITGEDPNYAPYPSALTIAVTVADPVDYDSDNDTLIEIANLRQLNAMRWDLDGNGAVAAGDQVNYDDAFPYAPADMGCTAACAGYELTDDLDFDTNNDGMTNAVGDDYWNDGAGWAPIGGDYNAEFHGNGHTIANLFINRGSQGDVGLFSVLGNAAYIHHVGLINVNVTGNLQTGALAGGDADDATGSRISAVYVNGGSVAGVLNVGGLTGGFEGTQTAAWTDVNVRSTDPGDGNLPHTGGITAFLVGSVNASYAIGSVDSSRGGVKGTDAGTANAAWFNSETVVNTVRDAAQGKTTAELQTPTDYTGIYANWDVDIDGVSGNDNPWDFGTSSQYPILKADRDGDGTATWQEFGDQGRPLPPDAPNAPTAGFKTVRSLLLTWDAQTGADNYDVRYKLPTAGEFDWTNGPQDVTEAGAVVDGLTPGQSYEFQVRATNDVGDSAWSPSSAAVTMNSDIKGGIFWWSTMTAAVDDADFRRGYFTTNSGELGRLPKRAFQYGGGEVRIHTIQSDSISRFGIITEQDVGVTRTPEAAYTLYTDGTPGEWPTFPDTTEARQFEAPLWGIGQKVKFRLVETLPPLAPAVTMTPGQTGEAGLLDIAWTPADNTGRPAVTEYKVRYKLASDTEWTDSSHYLPGSHEPAFFLQSLDTGAGYDVQMRAVNIDGDGPWSETATGSASNGFEDVAIWSATMTAGVQPVGGGGPRPFTRYGYVSNGAHGGLSSNAFSYNGQSYTVNDLYHSSANAFVPAHPTFNLSNALGGKLALVFRADGETHVLRFNGVTMSCAGGYDLTSSRTDWPGLPQWAAGTKVIVALVLAPELSVAAVNDPITEGASAEFAVTASRAPIVDLPVTLNIAAAGEYGVDTGNKDLVIPAGQTSAIYNAATTGNDVDAEDGTVTATLVGSVNYNVAASNTAQVMVNDNDSLSYEIWSAMLNSGELTDEDGTITGYFSGFVGSRYGALTPNTFDFRGATYTVDALSASGGNVTFTLNRGLGAGTFVLTVDGAACTFPGSSSGTYTCPGSIRTAAGIPVTLHQLQGPPVFGEGDTATRIIEENVGAEQSAAAAIVGPVSATDPNPGQTVTYALGGADAASFTLNANNGQLSTKAGVNYDYEAKPSYAVTVTATDDSGNDGNDDNSDSIDVTINLNDVLEPPLAPGQPTVAAQGETILSATVTPPDNTGRPSITGYQAQYRVNGSGDSFTVSDDESATPAFDISNLQANTEYEVQVRAVNADGNGAWSASGTGSTRGSTSGAAAEITITAGASPVTEADGAEVTFILTANAPAPVGGLSIAVGITTSGGDYVVTESMVLVAIAGGQTQGTHTIPIVNDNVDEPDGTVTATLVADVANPATYTLGSANTATVTVNDDEATPAVTLVLSPVAMIEFGGFTVVTAAMDPASSEETTIVLQEFMTAADGTLRVVYPTAEADRTLTIPAGATASSGDGVRVGTGDTDDALPHTSTPVTAETVTNTQGVTGPGPVTLRILDRETLNFRLVLSESTLRETDDLGTPGVNEAVVTVTASLDETLSEDVVVVVNPVPKDDRYELSANATLIIAAGSTVSTGDVTISSVNDDAHRSNLELDVRGEVTSNGGVGGLTLPPVTLTIENDDDANTNTPPTASIDASQETSANPNEIVYLGGVGSDTETVTAELTFAWTQTGGTPTVTLNLADAATANFTAPTVTSDTDLTFRLTVTDEGGLTDTAETTIAIKAPAAQGGNAIWEAELTVGQFGRSNAFSGYQQGQAGALSDYDFTVGGTDFTVGAVFLLPSSNFLSFVLSPSATPLPGSFIL